MASPTLWWRHQWLSGHEFEQTPGDGEYREAWGTVVHGVTKSWTWLSDWTNKSIVKYLNTFSKIVYSVQFSSVTQSCLALCNPMNRNMPDLPVHHQLLEFTQTRVHWVSGAIQQSHPLLFPSPPAPNPSQLLEGRLWST